MSQKRPPKCCHPDCEHCPYDDCQWDGMEISDYKDTTIDALNFPISHERKLARARANRYAQSHREKIREYGLRHYCEHREEYNARSRKWQAENKDRVAANKRKRWAENPEYYRQKQRDYRARKKAEAMRNAQR
ncbi:MAG: hypothetical protein Q4F83_11015 [Eubacteriales bacterium]|nr:hypothetical protein [Eubacteriales bacterium]